MASHASPTKIVLTKEQRAQRPAANDDNDNDDDDDDNDVSIFNFVRQSSLNKRASNTPAPPLRASGRETHELRILSDDDSAAAAAAAAAAAERRAADGDDVAGAGSDLSHLDDDLGLHYDGDGGGGSASAAAASRAPPRRAATGSGSHQHSPVAIETLEQRCLRLERELEAEKAANSDVK